MLRLFAIHGRPTAAAHSSDLSQLADEVAALTRLLRSRLGGEGTVARLLGGLAMTLEDVVLVHGACPPSDVSGVARVADKLTTWCVLAAEIHVPCLVACMSLSCSLFPAGPVIHRHC